MHAEEGRDLLHPGAHRIQHHVAGERQQAGIALHQDRLEASLEQVSDQPVAPVGTLGVDTVQLAHALGQVGLRCLDDHVVETTGELDAK